MTANIRIHANKANQELWRPAKFMTAYKPTIGRACLKEKSGFIHAGLGVFKWQLRDVWSITHLGSGHNIFCVKGSFNEVVEIATLLANAGDWNFSGLRGWENQSPNLRLKTEILYKMFSSYTFQTGLKEANESMADEIGRNLV